MPIIKAEFEAAVEEICYPQGSDVQAGDVVLRLIVMKMIFDIEAPATGTIQYVVAPEQFVQKGQWLARIEE